MFNQKSTIDVAIPLYNEESSVEGLFFELSNLVNNLDGNVLNFILVNDGSTDKTKEEIEKFFLDFPNFTLINHSKNLNLDGFLKTIQKNCKSDYVVFLDSDCTFKPIDIIKMIDLCKKYPYFDIINGSPYHKHGSINGVKPSRLLISKTANQIYRLLVKKEIATYTSIFKLYKKDVFVGSKIELKGFVSVAEIFIRSILKKSIVVEFPCELSIRDTGESKIRIFQSIFNHLKLMSRILLNKYNLNKI